ncbi:hypothetical protein AVEN_202729-1 [Araneus ventricosus]|uniref:Uncharacterized protein n=1 Tax=Araneus ventricosus TaxID=182803 RepID=A0A4Y2U7D2_ARAVE|nr:hypothetical protein AVEN_202729-1 [Araneus ventricosus]
MIRFSNRDNIFEYEADSPPPPNNDALDRLRCETILGFECKQYLKDIKSLFESPSNLTVVFGNLGRHPYLLTYYLDMCVDYDVSIQCRWDTHSPYQDDRTCNVIVRLEPDFDEIIEKLPSVRKLFVFTSHANFIVREKYKFIVLHVGSMENPIVVNDTPHYVFRPDVLHYRRLQLPPESSTVLVDISETHSKIECYLKILNAIEVLRGRRLVLKMPTVSFQRELERSKNHLNRFIRNEELEKMYFF